MKRGSIVKILCVLSCALGACGVGLCSDQASEFESAVEKINDSPFDDWTKQHLREFLNSCGGDTPKTIVASFGANPTR